MCTDSHNVVARCLSESVIGVVSKSFLAVPLLEQEFSTVSRGRVALGGWRQGGGICLLSYGSIPCSAARLLANQEGRASNALSRPTALFSPRWPHRSLGDRVAGHGVMVKLRKAGSKRISTGWCRCRRWCEWIVRDPVVFSRRLASPRWVLWKTLSRRSGGNGLT